MIDIPVLSQRDPLWAGKLLGFSMSTIGEAGCAVTALAMLINATHPLDENVTPAMVNTALKDCDAFIGPTRNNVAWYRVPRLWPRLSYYKRIDAPNRPLRRGEMAEINRRLVWDVPVIAYVDGRKSEPGVQQHFVLIVGHDPHSRDYIIADPWYGDAAPLCRRYGPTPEAAICGLILYDLS